MNILHHSLKKIKNEKITLWEKLYTGTTDIVLIDWLSDTYSDIDTWFRVRYERIERFFYWGWKLRKSHDFDSAYLYEIMYLKLDRMIKCFINHGHCTWDSDYDNTEMRKIRLARECCRLLKEDNFCENMYNKHYEKWGFSFEQKENKYTEKEKKQREIEFRRISEIESSQKQNCLNLLTKLLKQNSKQWWD